LKDDQLCATKNKADAKSKAKVENEYENTRNSFSRFTANFSKWYLTHNQLYKLRLLMEPVFAPGNNSGCFGQNGAQRQALY
jgi:hypothetical protein